MANIISIRRNKKVNDLLSYIIYEGEYTANEHRTWASANLWELCECERVDLVIELPRGC